MRGREKHAKPFADGRRLGEYVLMFVGEMLMIAALFFAWWFGPV